MIQFCRGILVDKRRLYEQRKPVFCFVTLLQCDLQFCSKIGSAVRIIHLMNICADACGGALQLIHKRIVPLYYLAELNGFYREVRRQIPQF